MNTIYREATNLRKEASSQKEMILTVKLKNKEAFIKLEKWLYSTTNNIPQLQGVCLLQMSWDCVVISKKQIKSMLLTGL